MTNGNFNFTFSANHKAELEAYINDIITVTRAQVQAKRNHVKGLIEGFSNPTCEVQIKLAHETTDMIFADTLANRQLRIQIIENLTDCYFAATDETPNAKQLERLADAILNEELTDQRRNKMQAVEYSFMSTWQLDARHEKEYAEVLADGHGADGRNYNRPTRRVRTGREHHAVNKQAKSRNDARKAKYREFTKVQPVKRWNMYTGEVFE
ncbi:hypothetical protein [Priestia megaterium]|uniref:hypothetical protein n=1 Tax=Priestia megaterium TaxID=1404 RepID=UPI0039F700DF